MIFVYVVVLQYLYCSFEMEVSQFMSSRATYSVYIGSVMTMELRPMLIRKSAFLGFGTLSLYGIRKRISGTKIAVRLV